MGIAGLRRGELISAASALGLLVVLFAFAWYGVAGVPDPTRAQPAIAGTENGWQALSLTRWVLVVTALLALGALVRHATERRRGRSSESGGPVLVLGLLSVVLLLWRVVIDLPSPDSVTDQKLGALLGLACACGIALGGHESLTELRARRRADRPAPSPTPAAQSPAAPSPAPPAPAPAPASAPTSEPAGPE